MPAGAHRVRRLLGAGIGAVAPRRVTGFTLIGFVCDTLWVSYHGLWCIRPGRSDARRLRDAGRLD